MLGRLADTLLNVFFQNAYKDTDEALDNAKRQAGEKPDSTRFLEQNFGIYRDMVGVLHLNQLGFIRFSRVSLS